MIDGIPLWVFYAGAAFVMLVSFAALAATSARPAAARASSEVAYPVSNLLDRPMLGLLLGWRAFRTFLQAIVAAIFVLVILAGLFGRQQGGSNIATVVTWTYWWILLIVFVMLFGKAWCYICPWDAIADWLERRPWRRAAPRLNAGLKWPRAWRNLYPATALFLGLTWLELGYGVTTRPEWTAYLGLLMFLLSFGAILLFERRSFCRYGCLVGRIAGLYSLFASLEVRARDTKVCRTKCRTYECYAGSAAADPCPTFQFLGGLTKNTYCIVCLECVRACPHENVAINIRPFGRDLVKPSGVRVDEAAMVIVMLAMSTFHGITMTPVWAQIIGAIEARASLTYLPAFTIGMAGFLAALAFLYVGFVALSYAVARTPDVTLRQLAIRYSYSFLPIALFYHLAHNAQHFFVEGGTLVPVLSDPFGWGWNLFGTANAATNPLLPAWGVWALMVAFILIGHVWSLAAGHRIAAHVFPTRALAIRSELPLLAGMIAYSILSLWIVAQPMQMRTGL
jgi:polyferredoxin